MEAPLLGQLPSLPELPSFDSSAPALDNESIRALFAQLERELQPQLPRQLVCEQQPQLLPQSDGPDIGQLIETAKGNMYSSGLTCEEVYVAAELTERRERIRDLQRLRDHFEALHKKAASELRACLTRLTEERNSMVAFREAQDQRLRLLRLEERTAARKWLRNCGMLPAEGASEAPPAESGSRKTRRPRTVRST